VVEGDFWTRDIARHDRRRLAYAVWTVLAQRLLPAANAREDAVGPGAPALGHRT
jgi:hypothetical protein